MRKSNTHVALDKKPNRYTVHQRNGLLAIHDTKTKKEYPLYTQSRQTIGDSRRERLLDPFKIPPTLEVFDQLGNKYGFGWNGLEAHYLTDWLNWRAAKYKGEPPRTAAQELPWARRPT